jgi:hypothetical protein
MYTVTKFPHGTFSWADLVSTDQAKARDFYVALMGWDTEDSPMGPGQVYTFFKKDGHNVAAVGPMQPEMQQSGMPSFWGNYITVDDVDALVPKVAEAGGKVVAGPFDVFDNGSMMTVQDPGGGTVMFWQAKGSIGAGLVNDQGAMVWNELATREMQKAQDFYGAVLGWTFSKLDDPDMDYYLIHNNGRMNGGIMAMDANWGEMPSHWMTYFNVKDVDAVAEKAVALGGRLGTQVSNSSAGRFVVISDPTGGTFTAIEASIADPWLEHESAQHSS